MRFQDTPIRRKLMTMVLGTSGVVLLLTCASFIGYEFLTYRQAAIRELSTVGEIIATQSTGAVAFDNFQDATEILSALKAEKHIVAACVYDRSGKLFARYPSDAPDSVFPTVPLSEGHHFVQGHLAVSTPLVQVKGSDRFGMLYLNSDMGAMYERLWLYAGIAILVFAVSSSVAYLLSRIFQQQISRPILALADIAKAVSDRRDYSVRATKHGHDELGLLTEAFNHMLAEIQEQNAVLEQRVRERTAELEAANDELEAFGSSAAHDLRTPLRAIAGFTEVLLDERTGQLPPEAKRYATLIRTGAVQMSRLIDDLLSFSRLGRQQLARQTVDLEGLCRDVLREMERDHTQRRIDITIEPLPVVDGDPALLRVVFVNLLSNAFKYSKKRDRALVHVGVSDKSGSAVNVIFVRDNGVGFEMQHAAGKLFGVFQRLHLAHEFDGTGVGLATVRRIVERHGGEIWAEAAPEQGATFFFALPKKTNPVV